MTQMEAHRLRREITATQLANAIVNRMGATLSNVFMMKRVHSQKMLRVAIIVASNVFDMNYFWTNIEALDNQVVADVQSQMMVLLVRLIRRACRGFCATVVQD